MKITLKFLWRHATGRKACNHNKNNNNNNNIIIIILMKMTLRFLWRHATGRTALWRFVIQLQVKVAIEFLLKSYDWPAQTMTRVTDIRMR